MAIPSFLMRLAIPACSLAMTIPIYTQTRAAFEEIENPLSNIERTICSAVITVGAQKLADWSWDWGCKQILSSRIFLKGPHSGKLQSCLRVLAREDMLTMEARALIIQHAQHAEGLGIGFRRLAAIRMLNSENFHLLLQYAPYADGLSMGIMRLELSEILTTESRNLLIQNAPHAAELGEGLQYLSQEGILTPENRDLLIQNTPYAVGLSKGLAYLATANILTAENRDLLLQNVQYAEDIGMGLILSASAGILTQEIRNLLSEHAQHLTSFAEGVICVTQAEIPLTENRTSIIKNLLLSNTQHISRVAKGLIYLNEAEILTPENFDLLIQHAPYAEGLGKGLACLAQAGILTIENQEQLLQGNGAHIQALSDYLNVHTQLNQKKFNEIMRQVWEPGLIAATVIAEQEQDKKLPLSLPPDTITHIASFLNPSYKDDSKIQNMIHEKVMQLTKQTDCKKGKLWPAPIEKLADNVQNLGINLRKWVAQACKKDV